MKTAALITGGATRVGRLLSEHLVTSYDVIIILYHSSHAEAMDIQSKYSKNKIVLVQCDIKNEDSVVNSLDEVFTKYMVKLLVNNASVMTNESLSESSFLSLQNHYQIHLFSPVIMSKYIFNQLNEDSYDLQIINILDVKIYTNQSKRAAYLLSKKSLADFTKMAALEFAPKVRVNGIAIGWIYDPNGKARSQEEHDNYLNKIPLHRKVSESDLLSTIDYISSNLQLTGQIINLAGGSDLTY